MKVKIVFDLCEEERRAINNYFGREGNAPYELVKSFIEDQTKATIEALFMDDDISNLNLEGEE